MSAKLLVIAAHPDDELLGCGGTVARLRREHGSVENLILGGGRGAVADNCLDAFPLLQIIQKVEAAMRDFDPDIVFTHSHKDLNVDHRIAAQAVVTACRPAEMGVSGIYAFETVSSTEWNFLADPFRPQNFVELSDMDLQEKLDNLYEQYGSELRQPPHPRSLEGVELLAKWRGAQAGFELAEAFEVVYERITLSGRKGF